MLTDVVVLSGSSQIRFTGTHLHGEISGSHSTHLHGETSGSHSIYMGRWLILGTLWNLHGEIGVLHAIYMGRLSLEAMSLPLDWLLKAQKVPPLTNSIFL